jgi:hypothetical protein
MSAVYYGFYVRMVIAAVSFVAIISAGIYAATRRRSLVLQYFAAHVGALLLGTMVDVALVLYVLPSTGVSPAYMNAIFMAPIVFFVGFSIYICHRGTVMHAIDILLPIAPIVAWGCLVVFGWQRGMGDYDVLGAWFVSAGCGGVDLAATFGPSALKKRPLASRIMGYALMVAAVYLILPRATA